MACSASVIDSSGVAGNRMLASAILKMLTSGNPNFSSAAGLQSVWWFSTTFRPAPILPSIC
jgi:hypothetical protein